MVTYQPTSTTGIVTKKFPVKTGETIEIGEIVYVDSGVIAATTTSKGPYYVALESSAAAVPAYVMCGVEGEYTVQAHIASAIELGDYVELSTVDAGEVTLSDQSEFYDVVGKAMEAAATTATTLKVLLGV